MRHCNSYKEAMLPLWTRGDNHHSWACGIYQCTALSVNAFSVKKREMANGIYAIYTQIYTTEAVQKMLKSN